MQTKITLLTICFIVILLFTIYYFYLLFEDHKNNKQRQIKQNNKILFYKLKKQYLNNVSDEDIKDLIYFLENELKERNHLKK